MSKKEVTIINYGLGNILSVERALQSAGSKVKVLSDYNEIRHSNKIILPGVGSFGYGINKLKSLKLFDTLIDCANKGIPVLGICLGMQLLFESSYEFGKYKGLSLLEGEVLPLKNMTKLKIKIPHINWSKLEKPKNKIWEKSILRNIDEKSDSFYFIHSYSVKAKNLENVLAFSRYNDVLITSVVQKENVFGCQFHPEKSAKSGFKIIRVFLEI